MGGGNVPSGNRLIVPPGEMHCTCGVERTLQFHCARQPSPFSLCCCSAVLALHVFGALMQLVHVFFGSKPLWGHHPPDSWQAKYLRDQTSTCWHNE